MTKKGIAFWISMSIIAILLNIIWILTDIETYMFMGIGAIIPTIAFINITKEAINVFKAEEEI